LAYKQWAGCSFILLTSPTFNSNSISNPVLVNALYASFGNLLVNRAQEGKSNRHVGTQAAPDRPNPFAANHARTDHTQFLGNPTNAQSAAGLTKKC
jgi:hypothetical protein